LLLNTGNYVSASASEIIQSRDGGQAPAEPAGRAKARLGGTAGSCTDGH